MQVSCSYFTVVVTPVFPAHTTTQGYQQINVEEEVVECVK